MTEPCLNRCGSLIGSSFHLSAVRGPLSFTSCPKNALYRNWGLLQIRGSSILNEQANCSERVFGNKICAQECMDTTGGKGWQWCIQCLGSACRMYGGHNVWGRGSYCRWKLISPRQITQDPPLWGLGRRKVSKLQTDTKAIRKESGRISSKKICRWKINLMYASVKEIQLGPMAMS